MRRPCKCGLPFDPNGRCPHCDYPAACPAGCAPCQVRDSKCAVCGFNSGSPAAADYHEKGCRERERKGRR